MKIVTVVGARPQFVKAAVVSRELEKRHDVVELLLHTGQHYDANMSDVFFEEMDIPKPAYHLGIGSGGHGAQTGRMLAEIERVLLDEAPDWVLVYGDTNSTLAGALAAVKLHIRVAHVEAGLRSFNRRMPEEINRILTDHAADVLYAPTATAVENLQKEGLSDQRVVQVGDVMLDASLYYRERAKSRPLAAGGQALNPQGYVLATLHRAETTDDPNRLAAAVGGLAQAGKRLGLPVVLPLHPRTRKMLAACTDLAAATQQLAIVDPVGFFDMLQLEAHAAVVATDSGGVQKEAYFFQVPCVTLRDETEWVELVASGWNRLAPPTDAESVAEAIVAAKGSQGQAVQLYGDGQAAAKIVGDLVGR